jgi:hypothetical protein
MAPLANDPERERLADRAARIERVLAALRDRRRERSSRGSVPAPLNQSIGEFAAQLARVRAEQRANVTPAPETP